MISEILNLAYTQVLGKNEQTEILGGQNAPIACGENNPCNMAGWCCADNICIPSGPDENGIWPRCDYM